MGLPPIPIPDTLKGVDDLIRSGLEEFRELWFTRLLVSTALVVVGLLFEAPEIWHETVEAVKALRHSCKPERSIPAWMKLVGTLGWLLIVVGVAGEFVADSFVSKADGFVQKFDEILLAETTKNAGDARTSAKGAADAAKLARDQSDTAASSASNALALARGARQEADSFEQDIASAKKQAADAESHLADALERVVAAEREIIKLKTPRSLSDEQQKRIASRIKSFAGTPFDLWVSADSESTVFLESLDAVLRSAEWKFNSPEGAGLLYGNKAGLSSASGVQLHVPIEHQAEWGPAIIALSDALSVEGIDTRPLADNSEMLKNMKRDRIHVIVGSKPAK